jgi:myo-inositol 2-dehydrogenase / D-chiro-inositol 1-dehydrogenase
VSDLRVGVVGAGFIATAHVHAYASTPGVRVVAIADPVIAKAQGLASEVGARATADADELLHSDLDIVSVCTPSPTHAALAVSALEAGLHVLCEKPIARTLTQARQIVAAGRAAPGLLMIGHVSRFEPDHRQAKDVVEAGHVGAVQMMSHSMTTSLPGWSEGGWFADFDQSGGPLVDLAVHSFDFLAWIAGSEPVRLHAVGADTGVGPTTYALVTVRYASGAIALVETSWAHPASHGFKLQAEIIGTDGRLHWSYDGIAGGVLSLARGDSVSFEPLGDRGFRAEIASFVQAVRTSGTSPVPAAAGFTALRTALAAAESVATGAVIDMTEWGLE